MTQNKAQILKFEMQNNSLKGPLQVPTLSKTRSFNLKYKALCRSQWWLAKVLPNPVLKLIAVFAQHVVVLQKLGG